MGKSYRQPKDLPVPKGGGYPVSDVGKDNIMVKGRWPDGTKQKVRRKMRGSGAATKGFMYYDDEQD